ncbi:MAG: hypothetical protein WAL54_11270, partial [Acinetobacter bohemicus]
LQLYTFLKSIIPLYKLNPPDKIKKCSNAQNPCKILCNFQELMFLRTQLKQIHFYQDSVAFKMISLLFPTLKSANTFFMRTIAIKNHPQV